MSFSRSFQLASYLLLLAGFMTVLIAGGVKAPTAVVFLAAVVWSGFRQPYELSRSHQWLLASLMVLAALIDAAVTSGGGPAVIRLLLALGLLRIFTRRAGRDYLSIYLISFALVLIAATYTISISYFYSLVAYLFFAILALSLFEGRRAFRQNPDAPFSLMGYLQTAFVMTALVVLLAIPIFLAIPRGSLGILGGTQSDVVGFSTSVNLGDIGKILNNSEVVMRVSVDRNPESLPRALKWRGIGLDYYDGKSWNNTTALTDRFKPDSKGRFLVAQQRRQKEWLLEQTFQVDPFTDVIFGAADVIQLFGFNNFRMGIWKDQNQTFFLRPRAREPMRYVVHSDLRSRQEKMRQTNEGSFSNPGFERYLQLPELDERIPALAAKLTEGGTSDFGKALLLESFLRSRYQYTLENPSGSFPDPLASFLFDSRAGHCEYFATAQAVMLRVLGIPSRVVNGFRRGEYNSWGDYYVVRQSDAHSWVEAYFQGAGWLDFDPTPPHSFRNTSGLFSELRQFLDSLDTVWSEAVTFDRFKQIGFFQSVRTRIGRGWVRLAAGVTGILRPEFPGLRSARSRLDIWVGCFFFLLMVVTAGVLLFRGRQRVRAFCKRYLAGSPGTEVVQEYFVEMLRVLERKGFKKEDSETPAEFSRRVGRALESDLPSEITEIYYRSRFGRAPVLGRELTAVADSLKQLRRQRLSQNPAR
jgi:transglutaminase-like putative cysteine protease